MKKMILFIFVMISGLTAFAGAPENCQPVDEIQTDLAISRERMTNLNNAITKQSDLAHAQGLIRSYARASESYLHYLNELKRCTEGK